MIIGIDARPVQKVAEYAGIGVSARSLVKALVRLDSGHDYVLFHQNGCDWDADEYGGQRSVAIRRPQPERKLSKASDLAEQFLAPAEAYYGRLDCFHSLTLYKQAFWYPCPSITTIHDVIPLVYADTYLKTGLMHRFLYACARRRDHIITISEHARKDIHTRLGIPLDRISVTYLAADERFKPVEDKGEIDGVLHRHGIQGKFLLYIGSFQHMEPRKNLDLLLDVYGGLLAEGNFPCLLVLAGKEGPYSETLRARVAALGLADKVVFTGYVADDDLPALLSAAEVFVYPSLYEGFGLPVLEAISCGTPTVASDTSSIPEVLGDGGILFDPEDGPALGRALLEAVGNGPLREALRRRGLDQAGRFSWERTAMDTIAIYERVGTADERSASRPSALRERGMEGGR